MNAEVVKVENGYYVFIPGLQYDGYGPIQIDAIKLEAYDGANQLTVYNNPDSSKSNQNICIRTLDINHSTNIYSSYDTSSITKCASIVPFSKSLKNSSELFRCEYGRFYDRIDDSNSNTSGTFTANIDKHIISCYPDTYITKNLNFEEHDGIFWVNIDKLNTDITFKFYLYAKLPNDIDVSTSKFILIKPTNSSLLDNYYYIDTVIINYNPAKNFDGEAVYAASNMVLQYLSYDLRNDSDFLEWNLEYSGAVCINSTFNKTLLYNYNDSVYDLYSVGIGKYLDNETFNTKHFILKALIPSEIRSEYERTHNFTEIGDYKHLSIIEDDCKKYFVTALDDARYGYDIENLGMCCLNPVGGISPTEIAEQWGSGVIDCVRKLNHHGYYYNDIIYKGILKTNLNLLIKSGEKSTTSTHDKIWHAFKLAGDNHNHLMHKENEADPWWLLHWYLNDNWNPSNYYLDNTTFGHFLLTSYAEGKTLKSDSKIYTYYGADYNVINRGANIYGLLMSRVANSIQLDFENKYNPFGASHRQKAPNNNMNYTYTPIQNYNLSYLYLNDPTCYIVNKGLTTLNYSRLTCTADGTERGNLDYDNDYTVKIHYTSTVTNGQDTKTETKVSPEINMNNTGTHSYNATDNALCSGSVENIYLLSKENTLLQFSISGYVSDYAGSDIGLACSFLSILPQLFVDLDKSSYVYNNCADFLISPEVNIQTTEGEVLGMNLQTNAVNVNSTNLLVSNDDEDNTFETIISLYNLGLIKKKITTDDGTLMFISSFEDTSTYQIPETKNIILDYTLLPDNDTFVYIFKCNFSSLGLVTPTIKLICGDLTFYASSEYPDLIAFWTSKINRKLKFVIGFDELIYHDVDAAYINGIGLYKLDLTDESSIQTSLLKTWIEAYIDEHDCESKLVLIAFDKTTAETNKDCPEDNIIFPGVFCVQEKTKCYKMNYNWLHLPSTAYKRCLGFYKVSDKDYRTAAFAKCIYSELESSVEKVINNDIGTIR